MSSPRLLLLPGLPFMLALVQQAWATGAAAGPASLACDHAIVGAGPAGIYYAWRLAGDAGTRANTSICIFDRLQRVGGRVASMTQAGPQADLVVEPGAYRFAPEKFCSTMFNKTFCLQTPILGQLIEEGLKLRSKRYNPDPTAFDYHLFKIVDELGEDAGFAQYVWTMLRSAETLAETRGIQLRTYLGHTLERVQVPEGAAEPQLRATAREPVVLHFQGPGGAELAVPAGSSVMLNLPQMPLMQVLAASGSGAAAPVELHGPNPATYMKLYLHYPDAWWRGSRYGLNKASGNFSNVEETSRTILPGMDPMHGWTGAVSPAPLHGAYHDGHVKCKAAAGTAGFEECRGYVQAQYSDDFYALMYYQSFGLLRTGEAIVNVTASSHGAPGSWLLNEVHAALVDLHAAELAPEVREHLLQSEAVKPDHAILSMWGPAATGFGAACHFSRMHEGQTPQEAALDVARHALRPFLASSGEGRVFVASEAFAQSQCWSEGALELAENALQRLGLAKPAWMTQEVYEHTLFTDAGAPPSASQSARDPSPPPSVVMGLAGPTAWAGQGGAAVSAPTEPGGAVLFA